LTGTGKAARALRSAIALPFLFFFLPGAITAQDNPGLPEIQRLDNRDSAFVQYLSDVETARRKIYSSGSASREARDNELADSLTVFVYSPRPEESLLTLAARCSVYYSSIATINRISNTADFKTGAPLLLPSVPGLFIPEYPETHLELLLSSSREEKGIPIVIHNGNIDIRCRFIPGEDFNPTERIFFLNRGFIYPLKDFRITSSYGPRQNPVTGNHGIHQGLDLAAPPGTPVYSVREGRVSEQGEDPVLGKYIIISHGDAWVSLYGHLSSVETVLRQQVNSGSLIGRVGSTGQSTGPHLHFELRQNGRAQDPEKLLRIFQGN